MVKEEFLESRLINGKLIVVGKPIYEDVFVAEYESDGRRCELRCEGCETTSDAFAYTVSYITATTINQAQDTYCIAVSESSFIRAVAGIQAKIYESASLGKMSCEWYSPKEWDCDTFAAYQARLETEMGRLQRDGYTCVISIFDPDQSYDYRRLKIFVSWEAAFSETGSDNEGTSDSSTN